jgi:prepilin peptidase CpaA
MVFMISAAALVAFASAMAFAAVSDLLSMTIPNRVPLALAAVFLLAALPAGMPAATIGLHAAFAVACLALTFGCFVAGWMGGGDAKLIAATALWYGPTAAMADYLVLASLCGGGLTATLLVLRWQLKPATGIGFLDRLLEPKGGVPYGIALGLAGLATLPASFWPGAS